MPAIRWSWAGSTGALRLRHPQINVLGGCCGTDQRHVERDLRGVRGVT